MSRRREGLYQPSSPYIKKKEKKSQGLSQTGEMGREERTSKNSSMLSSSSIIAAS